MLRFDGAVGLFAAARAETGEPLTLDRTDRALATPPVPFVAGVEDRAGVRFAGPGEDAEVLAVPSRRGVPVDDDLLAAVAIVSAVCLCFRVEQCRRLGVGTGHSGKRRVAPTAQI